MFHVKVFYQVSQLYILIKLLIKNIIITFYLVFSFYTYSCLFSDCTRLYLFRDVVIPWPFLGTNLFKFSRSNLLPFSLKGIILSRSFFLISQFFDTLTNVLSESHKILLLSLKLSPKHTYSSIRWWLTLLSHYYEIKYKYSSPVIVINKAVRPTFH